MDTLKKIFPLSWKFTKDVTNFVIGIIVHLLLGLIFSIVAGLASVLVGWIPVLGFIFVWLLGIVGSLIGLYSLIGLILLILAYCKLLKD